MTLESRIEAVLFWKAEPLTVKKLAEILDEDEEDVSSALKDLEKNLEGRGVSLISWENEYALTTAPGVSTLIESLTKEELVKDLGKAGLETLSIILYKGPVTRADIDYIRGVNSAFILRNLSIRGLVVKENNVYRPTVDLLAHLGIKSISDLPNVSEIKSEIEKALVPHE